MGTSMKDAYLYQEPHPLVIWNNMNQHEHWWGRSRAIEEIFSSESQSLPTKPNSQQAPWKNLKYEEVGINSVISNTFNPNWPRPDFIWPFYNPDMTLV